MAEVGTMEVGDNDGEKVRQYLGSVNLTHGFPWCAAFVYWCHKECDIAPLPARPFAAAAKWDEKPVWRPEGWSPQADPYTPISEDGDVGTLWYNNLGRIGHCFIIVDEDKDYVTTVEGNTGSGGEREGSGVFKRKRLKKSLHSVARWWPE